MGNHLHEFRTGSEEVPVMWARVSKFMEPRNRIDDDIRDSKESVKELLDRTSGSEGVYYLVDREAGRTMAITFWESEEALRASEDVAARIREESTARIGGDIVTVEHYEVALQPSDVMPTHR